MKKFLLLDADGVVIPKSTYFSSRYAEEFGVSVEKLMPFFKNAFLECQLGTKDLKETLPNYFTDWQWKGSIDDLLRYWFDDGYGPVTEVLSLVRQAREMGAKVFLATDQEKYRALYLWNDLELKKDFDGSFFSCNLGARKEDALYWEKVLVALGNPDPATVSFWDDEEANIETAQKAGINAHLFTSIEDLKRG